jgi:hypothetical protein
MFRVIGRMADGVGYRPAGQNIMAGKDVKGRRSIKLYTK